MELRLTDPEIDLLKDLLNADMSRLIHEIAKADSRAVRKDLKTREGLLEGILERIGGKVRAAS